MIGQKYKITVYVELPESPVNEEIGELTVKTNICFSNIF